MHKSLQNYNDFVWTVTWLNGYMNYSLAAVRLPIRKPGPHNRPSQFAPSLIPSTPSGWGEKEKEGLGDNPGWL